MTPTRIDTLGTTGIAYHDGKLARLLRSHESFGAEMLVYDSKGVESYRRLDFVRDPHDILWDGECYWIVSSGNNTVFRISPGGEIRARHEMGGDMDSWHLNCLLQAGPRLMLSAFGNFSKHREWEEHKSDGSGLVFDLLTRETWVNGLDCPHHPRFVGGALGICNSWAAEFLLVDPGSGKILRRIPLNAWTRGVVVSDDYVFVGESSRAQTAGTSATVAVICRKTWQVVERYRVPCDEIYDLVFVPKTFVQGLKNGFNTNNPLRVSEQDQHSLFRKAGVEPGLLWAMSDPLPHADCRTKIECAIPTAMDAGARLELECVVWNEGSRFFVSAPPNPVHIAYRWVRRNGPDRDFSMEGSMDGVRTLLPGALPPQGKLDCRVRIETPPEPGEYSIVLTLVQEHVIWFHLLDLANAVIADVTVNAVG